MEMTRKFGRWLALAFLDGLQPPVPAWFARWLPFLCASPGERAAFDRGRARLR
jgi:hypothetical protein